MIREKEKDFIVSFGLYIFLPIGRWYKSTFKLGLHQATIWRENAILATHEPMDVTIDEIMLNI